MMFRRLPLLLLAGGFSLFHVLLGIVTIEQARNPYPVLIALALYAGASLWSLVTVGSRPMSRAQAIINLAVIIVINIAVCSQLDASVPNGYATWHVAATGTLAVITLVRGHEALAWTGLSVLILVTALWATPDVALHIGVPGSIIWVVAASLLSRSLRRLVRDNARLVRAEQETARMRAGQDAHRRERLLRLRHTEDRALPMLREIVLSSGRLDSATRAECVLLEAGLRDEIRGRALLNDRLRFAVQDARRRGVQVQLLDEGSIDDISAGQRGRMSDRIAEALDTLHGGRVVVRTGIGSIAVTVVGLNREGGSGEEQVSLRLTLPREPRLENS